MKSIQEHGLLTFDLDSKYANLSLVSWSKPPSSDRWGFYASYKIGAEWVDDEDFLIVTAKQGMEKIDFLGMFMTCFSSNLSVESFSKIYSINYEQKTIPAPALKNVVSPLIVLHFIGIISRIKSLKKGYVHHCENLHKVKGHIKIQKNESLNISFQRYNRVYCSYDEYSVDIPENRLLKKALLFSKKIVKNLSDEHHSFAHVRYILARCLNLFENVGDEVSIGEVSHIKGHKLYKEYAEAVRLAKLILRHFDYSIAKVETADENVVPFVLDMSLLYEYYVYGLLYEAYQNRITYQFNGATGYPDFLYKSLDFKAILDTKYIPKYDNQPLETYVIRQLSGYSRDLSILRFLGYDEVTETSPIPNVPCIIIYPKEDGKAVNPFLNKELSDLLTESVKGLSKFYKISIPVPLIPNRN